MTVSHYYWITPQCRWRLNQLTKRKQQRQSEQITPSTWQQHHKKRPNQWQYTISNASYNMFSV